MSSSGDIHQKLEPVAELLPFEADLLNEESVHQGAEAFSEALVPEHAAHAQPALWWSQSAAPRSGGSALLVPDVPMCPAFPGHDWAPHMVGCPKSAQHAHAHIGAYHAHVLSIPGPEHDGPWLGPRSG